VLLTHLSLVYRIARRRALIMSGRGDMKYALPFGTFLAIGALVAAIWGTPIVDWYFGFYG
jgi:prepilin signal peptidase PulO-like enzyme (type II secretory pathway)